MVRGSQDLQQEQDRPGWGDKRREGEWDDGYRYNEKKKASELSRLQKATSVIAINSCLRLQHAEGGETVK